MALNSEERLCLADNWDGIIDADSRPRAIRWARRVTARNFNDPDWGQWHYTEGNGSFTACGQPVVLFTVDGSPQENQLDKVTCKHCLRKMNK